MAATSDGMNRVDVLDIGMTRQTSRLERVAKNRQPFFRTTFNYFEWSSFLIACPIACAATAAISAELTRPKKAGAGWDTPSRRQLHLVSELIELCI
jgi:hypothetical protein